MMTSSFYLRAHLGAFALLTLAGCGGTPDAFSTQYADNDRSDIEVLLNRVQNAPPRVASTVAVGITRAPTQLYGFDLASQRTLWKQPIAATSAPFLAGESVIFQTEKSVVGVSLRTGEKQFEVARGQKTLRGADGDGALAVFAMSEGQGTQAKSELVLARRGRIDWDRPIDGVVGVPAVTGTVVLVPWNNQYVTAVDVESGKEVARVRVRDGVLAHAFRDRESTYVGSQYGMTRVTESIGSGTLRGAGYFKLPDENLPGRPLLLRDVYGEQKPTPPDSATHRIQLAWEPRAMEGVRVGLQDDNVYLVFYRFVFALSPTDYSVRWVHRNEVDIVGAAAQPGSVVIADEGGTFLELAAASGRVGFRASSELPSTVVRIPIGSRTTDPGEPLAPDEQRAALLNAAQDTDARMVPGRILAVRALTKLDDAEATASLIALCDQTQSAPAVRTEACNALKSRVLGADYLLGALGRHAQYLEGTSTPPVGALARAAVGIKEKRAVEPLVLHLTDPNTPSSDLVAVVVALKELGDASTSAPLSTFLMRYHADPIDAETVNALDLVPGAIAALSGQDARPTLEAVMGDELGVHSVRQKARESLDKLEELAKAEKAKAEEEAQPPSVASVVPVVDPETLVPAHLTTELVEQALLPVRDKLQACLAGASKPTFHARAVLVIEEGKILMVSVLPAELQTCIEPLVRGQTFPKTRFPTKERMTHTVKR